jgi:hypothetical protein
MGVLLLLLLLLLLLWLRRRTRHDFDGCKRHSDAATRAV